jgi:hypothetical protein
MRKLKVSKSNWMEYDNGIIHKLSVRDHGLTLHTLCGLEFDAGELVPTHKHVDCHNCKTKSKR